MVRIRELMALGQKIEAIRVLREATGVDLAEAKRLVEAAADSTLEPAGATDDDFERELLQLLRAGQKIQAIKRHRERTGMGLKDSKDYVEALAARHGIAPAKAGCFGFLVVGLILAVATASTVAQGHSSDAETTDDRCRQGRVTAESVSMPPGFLRIQLREAANEPDVSAGTKADEGWFVHRLMSDFQAGPTEIKVLLPDRMEAGKRYPVLYVLPVEANNEHHYGDGLAEIKRCDIHNKHNLICVAPTFAHLPWYADHPTDKSIRQESYFVKEVVPLVERLYPARAKRVGRWLLGFSKSGWGAWSLLARHPDVFDRAAAWDAPVDMARFDLYGAGQVFGTQEHFETYRLLPTLKKCTSLLDLPPRLVLTGYDSFRSEHETAHKQLDEWKIPHVYRDGPKR